MKTANQLNTVWFSAALACALSLPAQAGLIANGGFESGLAGWTTADQVGSDGTFSLQTGTSSPLNSFPVPVPPGGTKAAMTDSGAGGSHVLYQDFTVPNGVLGGTVGFSLFLSNQAAFFNAGTLDWAAARNIGASNLNQQARVDIISTSADVFSVAGGSVLQNLFQTNPGDPSGSGYTSFLIDISALLQAHKGETLRLRFAEVDNVAPFNMGVDNVEINLNGCSIPPVIHCPSPIVVEFTREAGAVVTYSVSAVDNCDATPAVTCLPPSGSTFPIGVTTVNCTATDAFTNQSSCSFTVTVLGARGTKENVLAELLALRATVTDEQQGRKLDEAIEALTESLAPSLWVDQTHLERKHGDKVFQEEKKTIKKLCELIQRDHSHLSVVLQGFIERIFRADRLLASIVIDEAVAAGASKNRIDLARKDLAKGDAQTGDAKCANGIDNYRNAWKHAVFGKMSPPALLANGHRQLEILGEPGDRLTIQASSNLVDWVTLGICTANGEGVATFEDADAGRYPVRYYRVVTP